MATPRADANGHQRRLMRARVLAEETHCALCDQWVDKTLSMLQGQHGKRCTNTDCTGCIPHPMRAEIDEIIPRKHGGSPTTRENTQLMHRQCNRFKSTKPIHTARQQWANKHTPTKTPITTTIHW